MVQNWVVNLLVWYRTGLLIFWSGTPCVVESFDHMGGGVGQKEPNDYPKHRENIPKASPLPKKTNAKMASKVTKMLPQSIDLLTT